MNTAIGAAKYITRENNVPLTFGITLLKSPAATSLPQSSTNPIKISPIIPYITRLVAFFLLSSSHPETIRLNSPQVNIVTATPNTNTLRNAMRLPIIPSNHAVFQNNDPP
jgi:hypothetical protein